MMLNKMKISEWREKKQDSGIPLNFYIVYFGKKNAWAGQCEFFDSVFINPDININILCI